jgi:hypothetical protein
VLTLNFYGWLGEPWVKDGFDKLTAPVLLVLGLSLVALCYLQHRAETMGSERARRQFKVAMIVAGTVGVGILIGVAALMSWFFTALGTMLVVPWFRQSSFEDLLTLLEKGPASFVIAGILLAVIIIGAVGEYVYRLRSNLVVLPDATFGIVLALSVIGLGTLPLALGLSIMLKVVAKKSTSFPEGIGWLLEWLERNRNIKWVLPVFCVMLAAIFALHLYRRARWTGHAWRAPTFLGSAVWVGMVCIGLNFASVAALLIIDKGN